MSVRASLSSPFQEFILVATSQLKSVKNHRHLHIAFRPTFWHLPRGFQCLHPNFVFELGAGERKANWNCLSNITGWVNDAFNARHRLWRYRSAIRNYR